MKHLAKPDIEWRDLLVLTRRQIVGNVLLSLPFLLASWYLAEVGQYVWALLASFFFLVVS